MTDEPKLKDGDKEAALLLCPFCGKEPRFGSANYSDESGEQYAYTFIECCDVHCHAEDRDEAVRRWNLRLAASPVVQSEPVIEGKKADLCANTAEKSGTCATPAADAPTAETASAMNMTETTPAKTSTTALPEPVPSRESTLPELVTDAEYLQRALEFMANAKKMDDAPIAYMIAAAFKNEDALTAARAKIATLEERLEHRFDQVVGLAGRSYIDEQTIFHLESKLALLQQQVAKRDDLLNRIVTSLLSSGRPKTLHFNHDELTAFIAEVRTLSPYAPPEKETGG